MGSSAFQRAPNADPEADGAASPETSPDAMLPEARATEADAEAALGATEDGFDKGPTFVAVLLEFSKIVYGTSTKMAAGAVSELYAKSLSEHSHAV